jgi:hypothetical protein
MHLLEFADYEVKVAPEALLIKQIRMLWNQDRSKQKEKFFQQMSYLYFVVDPRSTYAYLTDKDERKKAVIEQEGLPADFKPSPLLEEAMVIYKQHTITVSQKLLEASMKAADTVSKFLQEVDLTEEDDKGRPKYKVDQITSALKNVEGIVSSLQILTKKVEQEVEDKSRARGGQKAMFEDGIDTFMNK